MKYNAEGTISVGQEFKLSGIKGDFSEIFDKSFDLIAESIVLDESSVNNMVSMKPIDKNQSLLLNFEPVDDGIWDVTVNAIYDVDFKFDTNKQHKDLAKMKVVKLLNKSQEIKCILDDISLSTKGIELGKTDIKSINVISYNKSSETELTK